MLDTAKESRQYNMITSLSVIAFMDLYNNKYSTYNYSNSYLGTLVYIQGDTSLRVLIIHTYILIGLYKHSILTLRTILFHKNFDDKFRKSLIYIYITEMHKTHKL